MKHNTITPAVQHDSDISRPLYSTLAAGSHSNVVSSG